MVLLDVAGEDGSRLCQFRVWDSGSLGRTYRGTRFVELKPYRHDRYPDYPYYRCEWAVG
ncbi:MAG: hypothetical protein HQL57_09330 [Magnetococcales bacterium]|nr:hypothetical protein [Magnetococcales bacterium]